MSKSENFLKLSKEEQFLEREKWWKKNAIKDGKKYIAPTFVQFNVLKYDDLNDENKKKVAYILEKSKQYEHYGVSYSIESMMSEIRKYDTSVLDVLIQDAFRTHLY